MTIPTFQQPGEPLPANFANPAKRFIAATRPAFLSVTLVACLLGLASAHADGVGMDMRTAVLAVLLALLAHAGANVINDYHDALSGADEANTGRIFPFTGGSRFIQNGVLTPRATALFGYGLLALVIPPGLWLVLQAGSGLILVGVAGLLLGWAYSAPPLKLASRGLGEFAIVACWLLVVVGMDFTQRRVFDWTPVAAGLSYALLVANVLYINQFPDHAGDAAVGKRTVVVIFGPDSARWGYFGIALASAIWLILQVGRYSLPQTCAAAALSLLLSMHAARQLREFASTPAELAPAIRLTILAALAHGLVLTATLALSRH